VATVRLSDELHRPEEIIEATIRKMMGWDTGIWILKRSLRYRPT